MSTVVEETTTDATAESTPDAFSQLLQDEGLTNGSAAVESDDTQQPDDEQPAEEENDESAEVEETPSAEEQPQESQPAGVSPAMRQTALMAGVPEEMLADAPDDRAAEWLINHVRSHAGQQQTVDDSPAVQWTLPEDEYDPKDPLHAQLRSVVDTVNREVVSLKSQLAEAQSENKQLSTKFDAQEMYEVEKSFDAGLDALALDGLGNSGSDKRQEVYALFDQLRLVNPQQDLKSLAQVAARAKFPELVDKATAAKQSQKLKAQSKEVVGGGPSPKHVEKAEDPMQAFLENVLRPELRSS